MTDLSCIVSYIRHKLFKRSYKIINVPNQGDIRLSMFRYRNSINVPIQGDIRLSLFKIRNSINVPNQGDSRLSMFKYRNSINVPNRMTVDYQCSNIVIRLTYQTR